MANEEHLCIIKYGIEAWNNWRRNNIEIRPDLAEVNLAGVDLCKAYLYSADLYQADLSEANLNMADLDGANLRGANLRGADLSRAKLYGAYLNAANMFGAILNEAILSEAVLCQADLNGAKLCGADLSRANLVGANLSFANLNKANLYGAEFSKTTKLNEANLCGANLLGAHLNGVNLCGADLSRANLVGANLSFANLNKANLYGAKLNGAKLNEASLNGANLCGADLSRAQLVETKLENANLNRCKIYGISAWDVKVNPETKQSDLVITPSREPTITVDNLEIAQFIYLMLNNEKVRDVIDAMTSKVVLILGRFTEERKAVLDAMRDELRRRNLTPILFDFDKPASKDLTGTVETLARMARFIIADLTDPSSIPHELATIVPFLRTTPVILLKLIGSGGYSMFKDLKAYPWVLEIHEYKDGSSLISTLPDVIAPADKMAVKLRKTL
jgi:uncharacterized protein YjbI with pentapeptide repeats